jgi:hypothetical protein
MFVPLLSIHCAGQHLQALSLLNLHNLHCDPIEGPRRVPLSHALILARTLHTTEKANLEALLSLLCLWHVLLK